MTESEEEREQKQGEGEIEIDRMREREVKEKRIDRRRAFYFFCFLPATSFLPVRKSSRGICKVFMYFECKLCS